MEEAVEAVEEEEEGTISREKEEEGLVERNSGWKGRIAEPWQARRCI